MLRTDRAAGYFFGVALGEAAAGAEGAAEDAGAAPAPVSSMLKLQFVSTFFPPDFALTMTVTALSFSRCVTW